MQLFSHDLGIDLGTSNVLIYVEGSGVVSREPSVVAVDRTSGRILQVGSAAHNMLGRTPGNVVAMHPLKDGVISDHEMTVKMLQHLFRVSSKSSLFTPKPRVVVSVPSGITEVEERTVINAVIEAGARRVYLIEEPLAAGLGAGLDISGPKGHMVVDIGAGTTDVAILTMNGVAVSSSIKVGGNYIDDAIMKQLRRSPGIIVGQTTAEELKIQIGSAYEHGENLSIAVKGRDVKNGAPREVIVTTEHLSVPIQKAVRAIYDEIVSVLEDASAELVSDVAENGITLTGGGSQLTGLAQVLQERMNIPFSVADDPASCVAYGCGKSLSWINHMTEGPINIARKRLLRSRTQG